MEIFSGEKYSREAYDKAEIKAEGAKKYYENKGTVSESMGTEARQRIYDDLWSASTKAKKKVEKLYAKGRAEAIALNEEYDRLRIQAQEAIKAIAKFEREKLGMHE